LFWRFIAQGLPFFKNEERRHPAHQRYFPQRHVLVPEVSVPRKIIKTLEQSSRTMVTMMFIYPIPRSAEDSSGVPQTRQITAEQSPQISGSVISRAQFGQ
jgi:hypothetical protein